MAPLAPCPGHIAVFIAAEGRELLSQSIMVLPFMTYLKTT